VSWSGRTRPPARIATNNRHARALRAAVQAIRSEVEAKEQPASEPRSRFLPGEPLLLRSTDVSGKVSEKGFGVFDDGLVLNPDELEASWKAHDLAWRPNRRNRRRQGRDRGPDQGKVVT